MSEDYSYIPPQDVAPFNERIKCPYDSEGEMFIDMATYAYALLGVRYLLGDKIPPVGQDYIDHAVALAEAFGFYDREAGKVTLSGADIHSLYPNEVETRGGYQ